MRWKPNRGGFDWLHAGFSERGGGVSAAYGGATLNLGWTETDVAQNVAENRRRWVDEVWRQEGSEAVRPAVSEIAQASAGPELVTLGQVHSAVIQVLRPGDEPRVDAAGKTVLRGDGLLTGEPGLLLGVQTADCVPVLLADMRLRVVAAFHAGWRGTAARIVERGVQLMREEYGSRAEDLWAAVGPAIAACCYSVGDEVRESFLREFRYGAELFSLRVDAPRWKICGAPAVVSDAGGEVPERRPRMFLDLHESNRRQLLEAGVPTGQIDVYGAECTACSRDETGAARYFSYRAEHGHTGRMMSVIGVSAAESRRQPA